MVCGRVKEPHTLRYARGAGLDDDREVKDGLVAFFSENFAASIAMRIACSWKSGTPSVDFSTGSSSGATVICSFTWTVRAPPGKRARQTHTKKNP